MQLGELLQAIKKALSDAFGIEVFPELYQRSQNDIHIRIFEKQSELLIGISVCLSWRRIKLSLTPRYVINNSFVYQAWVNKLKENYSLFKYFEERLNNAGIILSYNFNETQTKNPDFSDPCAFFSIDGSSGYFEVRDNLDFREENIIPVLVDFWGAILSFAGVSVNDETPLEGEAYLTEVTKYERNTVYRRACIEHYGSVCQICGVNLENLYGDIARGFIEVHHIKPVSEYEEATGIDPVKDLIPVCPNCHAILHRRKPPYSPEQVKGMLKGGKR